MKNYILIRNHEKTKMILDGLCPAVFTDTDLSESLFLCVQPYYDNKGFLIIGESRISQVIESGYGSASVKDEHFYARNRNDIIKKLYYHWCGFKNIKPNPNEGWFKSKKFFRYLSNIGFWDTDSRMNWNYALFLQDTVAYREAIAMNRYISDDELIKT